MPISRSVSLLCTLAIASCPIERFGNRVSGPRLPIAAAKARHGPLPRYQARSRPESGSGRQTLLPGAGLLSNAEAGRISAYLHYNSVRKVDPRACIFAICTYLERSRRNSGSASSSCRSSFAGQRLDDLSTYGLTQGSHVGLNDLTLAQPRLGLEMEQHLGTTVVAQRSRSVNSRAPRMAAKPIDTASTRDPTGPNSARSCVRRQPIG